MPGFDTRSTFGSSVPGSSLSNVANFDSSSHYVANQREEGGCSTQFVDLTGRGNMTAKKKVVSLNRHKPLPRKSKEMKVTVGVCMVMLLMKTVILTTLCFLFSEQTHVSVDVWFQKSISRWVGLLPYVQNAMLGCRKRKGLIKMSLKAHQYFLFVVSKVQ
ncbi:uncharacterized protein LOC141719715 isoform X1 [Apium graveolens]|uniref:uncharacterized protein LOC141719715 isoform X1 n=1 Tax=Apium graveolens TaxID=4045 RepID=UPI003D79D428